MSKNTNRRSLYLTDEIETFLVNHSEENNIKINEIVIKALNDYMDRDVDLDYSKKFEDDVNSIIKKYLKAHDYS